MKIVSIPLEDLDEKDIVIDVSKTDFSSLGVTTDVVPTTFVYLRNIGYKYPLLFDKVDFQTKQQYMLKYLTDAIYYDCETITDEYLYCLLQFNNIDTTDIYLASPVFTKEERVKFITDNKQLFTTLTKFFGSLPCYAVRRLAFSDEEGFWDIPSDDFNGFCENINFLVKNKLSYLFYTKEDTDCVFFNHYFTVKNNDLFSAMSELPFMPILQGFLDESSDNWVKCKKAIDDFFTEEK